MTPDVINMGRVSILVPSNVIRGLKDARALGLYCILLGHARGVLESNTALKTLAVEMGLSESNVKAVRESLKVLEAAGLVKKYPRWCNEFGDISFVETVECRDRMPNLYAVFDEIGGAFSDE